MPQSVMAASSRLGTAVSCTSSVRSRSLCSRVLCSYPCDASGPPKGERPESVPPVRGQEEQDHLERALGVPLHQRQDSARLCDELG